METYRVIGPHRVADTDPGGTVELDPERVNIAALIAAGHVELVKAPEGSGPSPGARRATLAGLKAGGEK